MTARSLRLAFGLALGALVGCDEPSSDLRDAPPAAQTQAERWRGVEWPAEAVAGAVVYVPVYSHIYHQDGTRQIDLAATLSIRNTDPERSITVASVAYYDSDGRLMRDRLDRPLVLAPLGTRSFVVQEQDRTGGSGANFLVTWSASASVSEPLVETVMISTASSQGLSFVGEGRTVRAFEAAQTPPGSAGP